MSTAKRRCLYCFIPLPAGRSDMKYCDEAHRKAHGRREERTGAGYSDALRLVYLAADTATGIGRTLRKDIGPVAQMAADMELPGADENLRRWLAQTCKQLERALNCLRGAQEGFLNAELGDEARDELSSLLDTFLIDEPDDEEGGAVL
jgi:hypothetical protein